MRSWQKIFHLHRAAPAAPTGTEEELPVMSFGDHLEELRRRIFYALIGVVIAMVICLYYANGIIDFLYQPYLLALRWGGYSPHLQYFKPVGSVILYLMTAVKAGLVLASPWIIYQFWRFVTAGLYRRERLVVYRYLAPSILLFALGVAFFFFLVLPFLLKFVMQFNNQIALPSLRPTPWERVIYGGGFDQKWLKALPAGDRTPLLRIPVVKSDPTHFAPGQAVLWFNAATNQLCLHSGRQTLEITAQPAHALFSPVNLFRDYLSFVIIMCLVFGGSFELPMVMMILTRLGLVQPEQYRKLWRYVVLGLAVLAVLLAPSPDVFTFASIFVPLLALYVLGLGLSSLVARRRVSQ